MVFSCILNCFGATTLKSKSKEPHSGFVIDNLQARARAEDKIRLDASFSFAQINVQRRASTEDIRLLLEIQAEAKVP